MRRGDAWQGKVAGPGSLPRENGNAPRDFADVPWLLSGFSAQKLQPGWDGRQVENDAGHPFSNLLTRFRHSCQVFQHLSDRNVVRDEQVAKREE